MRKTLAIALLSVLALIGSSSFARAFVIGWNYIAPAACYGSIYNGVNYLIIYPASGGSLTTTDTVSITLAAPYCSRGGAFYVYSPDGSTWGATYLIP
jgi:hypothetical protein